MTDREKEKSEYIELKLQEIQKCFDCTNHTKEIHFKYISYKDDIICSEIMVKVEIMIIDEYYKFWLYPKDHIAKIDSILKKISNLILI